MCSKERKKLYVWNDIWVNNINNDIMYILWRSYTDLKRCASNTSSLPITQCMMKVVMEIMIIINPILSKLLEMTGPKQRGKKWVGRRASAEKVLCPGLQVDRGADPSAVVVLGGRPGPRWHRLQSTQLGSTPHLNPAQLQLQLQPTTTEEKQTRALCCRLCNNRVHSILYYKTNILYIKIP